MAAGEELVRRAYEAVAARDFERMAEMVDPDLELDMRARVLNPEVYRGTEGLRRFLAEIDELWASMEMSIEQVCEGDDEVFAVLRMRLEGRGSGVTLEDRVGQWWTLRDGRLLRLHLRPDVDAALRDFGAPAH